jgi:sugar O-acyltransferase (sialic acid O-acetyltransferase NeuD family)
MTNRGDGRTIIGLYGAGGFAREVMSLVPPTFLNLSDLDESVFRCFIEDRPEKSSVNGHSLLSEAEFLLMKGAKKFFNIAIADSRVREALAQRMQANGIQPIALQSRSAVVYEENQIGEGAIICAFCTITSNAKIGRFFHCNIYSYVAHDCQIGDFVTFAPGVHCNGNVKIGDHAYIGTGALLKQGSASKPLVIGEGAIVGMGAVVTRDVAPYTTVVGNPARILEKRN